MIIIMNIKELLLSFVIEEAYISFDSQCKWSIIDPAKVLTFGTNPSMDD